MPSGVYKITCSVTGKVYVGSAVNLYRRWHAHHLPELRGNYHVNKYLQAAWNKYGEAAFGFTVLEEVPVADLINCEQRWINKLQSANRRHGFNLCAVAASSLGTKHTAATKAKMAAVHAKTYIVRSPKGHEQVVTNLFQFCQRRGLTHVAMFRVAAGKARHHRSWECRPADKTREQWQTMLTAPPRRTTVVRGKRKWCARCERYRIHKKFNRDAQTKSGLAAYCQDCNRGRLNAAYRRRVQGAA